MCDPITIAGVALTGLSAGLGSMAQNKVAGARADALAAERIRQQGFQQQQQTLNTQAQDRYQDFGAKQDEKAKSLSSYFTTAQPSAPAPALAALPASESNLVVQEQGKQADAAKARTDQIGAALGDLRSFGDLLGSTSRMTARDAGYVGQIGNFMRGSQSVLPYELDAASRAGDQMSFLGSLARGLGATGVSAGLSGNPFAGALPATAPLVAAPGSRALGGALDRSGVPGYSGYQTPSLFSLFAR